MEITFLFRKAKIHPMYRESIINIEPQGITQKREKNSRKPHS